MKRELILKHEFVEYIPNDLKDGTIYVSMPFATVAHRCCCGCGKEVITPLSPTDWKLIFDGESISLDPSIGNWNFPCHSHYWITHNNVKWLPRWSQKRITAGRAHGALAKERYFNNTRTMVTDETAEGSGKDRSNKNLWRKLKRWCSS